MASQILTTFKQKVPSLELVPSGGGCFEVSANGELLYSKLETGQFPHEYDVLDMLKQRIK